MGDMLFAKFLAFLNANGPEIVIQNLRGGKFTICLGEHNGNTAIKVNKGLGAQNYIYLEVFRGVIGYLSRSEIPIVLGNAKLHRIGEGNMTPDSIEAFVAINFYNKKIGQWAFMRGHVISNVLVASGICYRENGCLGLNIP